MILYADASALVKLVLTEDGTDEIRSATAEADRTYSANIAYAEVRAAVAAAIRDRRVSPAGRNAVMALLVNVWDRVFPVGVDWPLVLEAGNLAEHYALRGYDAVHLAALLRLGMPGGITLACWDSDFRRAAAGLGYAVFPQ